jgi:hypothetical protein
MTVDSLLRFGELSEATRRQYNIAYFFTHTQDLKLDLLYG